MDGLDLSLILFELLRLELLRLEFVGVVGDLVGDVGMIKEGFGERRTRSEPLIPDSIIRP